MTDDKIRYVWFDLNGTLARETKAYRHALDAICFKAYAQAINHAVDADLKQEYREKYRQYGTKSAVFEAAGMPPDYWPRWFATLDQLKYLKPGPHVAATLTALAQRVPISLMSNTARSQIDVILGLIGILPALFTEILSGEDIPNPKPALDGFRLILRESEMPASAVLFVGDREDADIRPAKAVGLRTAYVWGESPIADYSFRDISEVLDIVN